MAEFKKGDRVMALADRTERGFIAGDTGTVEEDNSNVPWVLWDNGVSGFISDKYLELLLQPDGASAPQLATASECLTNKSKETTIMSVTNDLLSAGLAENQQFLLSRGVMNSDGSICDSTALLTFLLSQNQDAFVSAIKAAETAREVAKQVTTPPAPVAE